MNIEESAGGSSCKGQENGDAYNGSERPLKKARFAWQVKGKYHLKNDANDPSKSTAEPTTSEAPAASGGGSISRSNNIRTEQSLQTIGDYLLNQDFNSSDSTTDSDKSLSETGTPDELTTNDSSYEFESVPMSMVASEVYTEDQCIARWQARQIEKGPLDNTINRILDYIKQHPLDEVNSRVQAFDVADFINNLPGINSIENEGILMAISAHGLQNTSSSSSTNSYSSSASLDVEELCPKANDIMSPSIEVCLSPMQSDNECYEQNYHELDCALNNIQWPYSDDLKNDGNETISSPAFHDTSSLSVQCINENLHDTDAASDDVATESDNHHDFLDAAVLFAIQSKGLTTLGTDYG